MSWSDRRTLLVLALPALAAACGFSPAFGPGGAAGELIGRVVVADPADRNQYDLAGQLEERFGTPDAPVWALSYTIVTRSVGLGLTSDNAITRYDILGDADYTLTRIDNGQVVATGHVSNFVSYSASGTVVPTAASERDAYLRLMRILADQIVARLIAASASLP